MIFSLRIQILLCSLKLVLSQTPLLPSELEKKGTIPATKPATEPAQVDILNIQWNQTSKPSLIQENGRFRVVADVGVDGIDVLHPFPNLKPVPLGTAELNSSLVQVKADGGTSGHRPEEVDLSFFPAPAPKTNTLNEQLSNKKRAEKLDKGGTIFDADNRLIFQDTNYPWRITGKVRTAGGWGSGCMIGPRHVLTASHVIDWHADGTIGWASFTPGYYDGRGPWGEMFATETIYWEKAPKTLTDRQTALDYVVLVLDQRIGDTIGYAGSRAYDASWNGGNFWQFIGYPGDLSSGERPAFQRDCAISSKADWTTDGHEGSVLGHFNEFTPGQSGGPAWGFWDGETFPRVVGVGSTIGDTVVRHNTGSTDIDNEYGGGTSLNAIISWARDNRP